MRNILLTTALLTCFAGGRAVAQDAPERPLRALLIAGGCCHDYAHQQEAICRGIQARANVQVDVYWTDNSTTAPVLPLYNKLNWAEGYDVIIHDECAADIKDVALVNRIVQIHHKIPAVHLHCAMHSFRTGTDAWFQHLGLQSSGHGPQEPIEIKFVDQQHPITATLGDWTTIREELYNNVKVLGAQPLAVGKQQLGGANPRVEEAIVAWTNETQGARSFSTTIGHNTETVEDPRYLELVTRGLLWACGKLTPAYLQPYGGEHAVTFIDKKKFQSPQPLDLGQTPADATLVKLTASSTQSGHPPHHAIDGDRDSRWCADGDSYPQSLQLEFQRPVSVAEIQLVWEFPDRWYQYVVEGSTDAKTWTLLLDNRAASSPLNAAQPLSAHAAIKFLRVTAVGRAYGWCSIRELQLRGDDIGTLWPADTQADAEEFVPLQANAFASQGNTVPRIERLTAAEEAAILNDVRVPEGFEVTVFASPPAVNYPVFVAAGVDGTLYVSSDGNGSLGRDPRRGRVIRLRDLDGDGRADETKVFCEIDAPRGLVWDRDRLYVMHPPNLSVFFDHDQDGVADEQKTLVKNLAFGYDKRPADHTTNGVTLGVDGWLYIAGGDFGFMNAQGTDGRTVTHRGGGVIRVRPDGTGLEIYSTGTRNILEVAISPTMDLFARDNTNDGGGWDVRLHHFTGGEDHGYPRLYKKFPDECVQPLADYGGGSGCGAVYIDEPGFGSWNNAPFTADWGTGSLYRHSVSPSGATYEETSPPESFIKLTRPTDADVDGNSRVYCASWRGATFNWNGPDVGYIVCVKPQGYQPPPLPDFSATTDDELVQVLSSPSYRRRLEAQRELMRRGHAAAQQLLERAVATRRPARNLLQTLQATASGAELVAALTHDDPVVVHTAIRVLANRHAAAECFAALDAADVPPQPVLRALAMMHQADVVDGLISRLATAKGDLRREILSALCRLHFQEGDWKGDSWGTRPDTRGPYYQPETWSESDKIAATLQHSLTQATPDDAAALIQVMYRNRIESDDALDRMLRLAAGNDQLLPTAIAQLANSADVPRQATKLLAKAVSSPEATPLLLSDAVITLARMDAPAAAPLMLTALARLDTIPNANREQARARNAFVNAGQLDQAVSTFKQNAASSDSAEALWGDVALITIASKKNASPEARELARQTIESAWQQRTRRISLMQAAAKIDNHSLDDRIWLARDDQDTTVAETAKAAIGQLKIKPPAKDDSPKIASLSIDEAAAVVTSMQGDEAVGQRVFAKANCAACHTLRQDEPQKGPFLGNIAKTYKRPELAAAVLDPSKTIAQGFTTNTFLTADGQVLTGFVTGELSDRVTIRDQQGKELTILKDEIEVRKTMKTSVMPTGLVNDYTSFEVASLLDYLQSLTP